MIAALPWPPSGASGASGARIDWCDLNSSRAAGKGTPGELDRDTISAPESLPANRVLASCLATPWWSHATTQTSRYSRHKCTWSKTPAVQNMTSKAAIEYAEAVLQAEV